MRQAIISEDRIARIAVLLLQRWGGHPAVPDGEDSSGKQKYRMTSPQELAARAVDVAEAVEHELIARGHMTIAETVED